MIGCCAGPLGAGEEDAPCASIALTPGGARTIWSPPQAQAPERVIEDLPDPAAFATLIIDGQMPDAAIAMASAFRSAGKPVLLDAGSWKPGMERLVTLATEIIASAAFKLPGEKDTLTSLIDAGADFAAVTADDRPVCWRDRRGETGCVDPPRVEAVDTLAAGDVLHGAYAFHRWCEGGSCQAALAAAARVASRSVTAYGPRNGVLAAR
ncbi:MAG: PfkB family carbohydrate kinase [Oceanicaulis sp.]